MLQFFLHVDVDRLQLGKIVPQFVDRAETSLVAKFHGLVILSDIVVESALQIKQLFFVLEILQLLRPVSCDGFLVVTEDREVKLDREGFFKLVLGDKLAEQVADLLIEVVLEDLLDHYGQVLFDSQ